MNLPSNLFDGNINVRTFLCQPNKEIIGEIMPYDSNATFKFNTYSEISFTIDRYYNDLLEGKTKVNPYYDYIESLRVIYLYGIGHFIIQEVDEDVAESESKSVTCFSLEYATGQKYLENFYVNTGEEGSIETMYHAQQYGAEYSIDNYYTLVDKANNTFDAYERYYVKQYSNDNGVSYNYVEEQILDTEDYLSYEFDLYVKKYPNVRFYWPTKPELSLLHNVFDRIPEWKIGHVDKELWYQERTFSEDRTAVYDFLYNTAAETLNFVMVWDSINGVVNFYKTEEDGITTDNYRRTNVYNPNFVYYSDTNGTVAEEQPEDENDVINGVFYINVGDDIETQWDTDVFISRENLASTLDINYSTDDIKTKLKITGSDDLDVRDVNLGQNYILNLSYYNTPSWLGTDLHLKYNAYMDKLEKYTSQYKELISAWSATYNEYTDLMNYVPAEPRVMLIGDVFEKLYCVYNPYMPALKKYDDSETYFKYDTTKNSSTYLKYVIASPQPKSDQDIKNGQYYVRSKTTIADLVKNLQTKLETYRVDQDDKRQPSPIAKTDDVLLTLENDKSDTATIRVRYDSEGEHYRVYRTLTIASTGISNTINFSLTEWVNGDLVADYKSSDGRNMNLSGFKIKSIGTLGAYFCLTRDEMEKSNLEDYGIKLLQEKQSVYTKIFITQTEGYMNEEGSQCVTSNEEPTGDEYPEGTKWLDTNNTKSDGSLIMKIREGDAWVEYTPDGNDYENYARFYENYTKLGNVQAVLAEKQKHANYLLNGIAVNTIHLDDSDIDLNNLLYATIMHFTVLDNDFYITKLGESLPNENISEGAIRLFVDNDSLIIFAYKYTNGEWIEHNPEINITLTSYNKDFNYITFNLGLTPVDGSYKDGVIYYSDTNGTIADPQPSVIQSEINSIAQEYNALINGNVDYSKRPFVSPEEMRKVYPDFEGEIATTYSQYHTIGESEALYTIDITPILEDGTVLTQEALDEYVSNLITDNGIDSILASDASNLIIHIQPGDYDEEYWAQYQVQLDEIKQRHWALVKSFRETVYYTAEEYATYVIDGTPYVSYAHSQGLYLAKMNVLKELSDMSNPDNFSKEELVRLSPFIREDEFSDNNFLLTGYESEEEQMYIKQELLNAGEEELKKICQPKLSFSATMANILATPEFAPLRNQFKLGNFIRIGIRDGYFKRARLLEVQMNFDDPSDFSVTFGDLMTTKSEVDKHADLLSMAVSAGKSMASNQSKWQKGADKATELDQKINDGLASATLEVGRASGQNLIWNEQGLWGRKLKEGSTDEFEDEQFRIVNNRILFSDDGFRSSKGLFGKFTIKDENGNDVDHWGVLSDAVVSGFIEGSTIQGGSLRIGDGSQNYFQVSEQGDVKIVQAGKEKYASVDALQQIDNAYRYSVSLTYNGPTVFASVDDTVKTTITATVYERGKDITKTIDASNFSWIRSSSNASADSDWNNTHKGTKQIEITHADVIENSHFSCQVNIS